MAKAALSKPELFERLAAGHAAGITAVNVATLEGEMLRLEANVLLPFSSASVSEFRTVSRVCFGSFWDHASFEKVPQRYNQFARQSDDRNPPHSPRRVSNACTEPPR